MTVHPYNPDDDAELERQDDVEPGLVPYDVDEQIEDDSEGEEYGDG